jgi:hypothetical protein
LDTIPSKPSFAGMAEDDIARFVNVVIEMKKEIFQRYDDPACTPDAELMNVWPQPSSPWNAAVKSPREWVTCRGMQR